MKRRRRLEFPTLILVLFNEVEETLAEGLEHQTHVVSLFVGVNEVLFEVDDAVLGTSFCLDLGQDVCLNFGALVVSLDCPNDLKCFVKISYLDSVVFVFNSVQALESSSEGAISKVSINLKYVIPLKLLLCTSQ